MIISFSAVACIFYAFAGAFTKKRWLKWLTTLCLIIACVFIRELTKRPTAVRMKEDVLYIHPKNTIKSNNEIYNGSKDDPNLKQDTINEK